jgi:hypothetical protein
MSGKITKYNNLINSCLRSINIPWNWEEEYND